VDEDHVGIAPSPYVERLAGAYSNNLYVNALGFQELWQQEAEQTRLFRGGRGGDNNRALLRHSSALDDEKSKKYREREQSVLHVEYSGVSPLATSVASRSEQAASRLTH
jgi:hypothetical protein